MEKILSVLSLAALLLLSSAGTGTGPRRRSTDSNLYEWCNLHYYNSSGQEVITKVTKPQDEIVITKVTKPQDEIVITKVTKPQDEIVITKVTKPQDEIDEWCEMDYHFGGRDARLVGGLSPCGGTVEVHYKGQWVRVSARSWDLRVAAVVCSQLGCGSAVEAGPPGATFGDRPGPVFLANVSCSGSEPFLRLCGLQRIAPEPNGSPSTSAGVVCSGHRAARLAGGWDRCSGRLEVLRGTTWGSVCRSDFDRPSAEVVCRELHCGTPEKVGRASYFGRGGGPVWSGALRCQGNESRIFFCPPSPTNMTNCTLGEEAGLVCAGDDDSEPKAKTDPPPPRKNAEENWSFSAGLCFCLPKSGRRRTGLFLFLLLCLQCFFGCGGCCRAVCK
ncbi:soluble scavenger receptor cysteine-rich domain-containing protein SSC5D-like isoform X2 [Lepisosteus oculatus]|uniref:soluble scavenger receptor cysteine-rich domain-containing protein SSC5D-like isoform X2 n=1 Tax=Lepisosteus oculatus TaxID=7918 RepID=UPI0035F5190A